MGEKKNPFSATTPVNMMKDQQWHLVGRNREKRRSFETPLHEYFDSLSSLSALQQPDEEDDSMFAAEIVADNAKRHSRSVRKKAIAAVKSSATKPKREKSRRRSSSSSSSKHKTRKHSVEKQQLPVKTEPSVPNFHESFGEDHDWTYDGTDDTVITSSSRTIYPFLPPSTPPRIPKTLTSISSTSTSSSSTSSDYIKSPLRHSVSSSSFLSPTPPIRRLSPLLSNSFLSPTTIKDGMLADDDSTIVDEPTPHILLSPQTPTQRRRNTLSTRSFQNPSPTCVLDDIYGITKGNVGNDECSSYVTTDSSSSHKSTIESPARTKRASIETSSKSSLLIMSPRSARWSSASPRILKMSNSMPSSMDTMTKNSRRRRPKNDEDTFERLSSSTGDWQSFQSSPGVEWNSPSSSSSKSSRRLVLHKPEHSNRGNSTDSNRNEQWMNLPPLVSPCSTTSSSSSSSSSLLFPKSFRNNKDDPKCMPPFHPKRKLSLTDQFSMLDL